MVTIDCAEPQQLAAFWSEALGVSIQGDYGDFVFVPGRSTEARCSGCSGYPNHVRERTEFTWISAAAARH